MRASLRLLLKPYYVLVDLVVFTFMLMDKHLSRIRLSKTGYSNPRVRNMVGSLGYAMHAARHTLPNLRKWIKYKTELFPTVIQVQTINRCHAACEFCPYPYTIGLQEKRVMDDALYTKIVNECVKEADLYDFVPMSKNEPLLDMKMEQRVTEFRAKAQPHQMVELVTNGIPLTSARAQRLIDAGVDLITISVNASNERTYQKVMKGLSWKQLLHNLEAISKLDLGKVNIYLRFVADQTNRHELKIFRKKWKHFNVFFFNINNRAGTVNNYQKVSITYQKPLSLLRRAAGSHVYPVCPYVFSMMHVLENGDVPMCSNDWDNREVLGNVRTQTIREIYNSPRMNEIRQLMLEGRFDEIEVCRQCSFYHEWMKDPLALN